MLARRFTIVCLLTALFGMSFAMLVAEAGRSHRSRVVGQTSYCGSADRIICGPASPHLALRFG